MRVYQVIWLEVVMRLLTENIPRIIWEPKQPLSQLKQASGQVSLSCHGNGEEENV